VAVVRNSRNAMKLCPVRLKHY